MTIDPKDLGSRAMSERYAHTSDDQTLQTLLDLLNPLHRSLDRQTYDIRVQENFDAPPDAEYAVDITAQQERDLTQAVCILEDRIRRYTKPHQQGALIAESVSATLDSPAPVVPSNLEDKGRARKAGVTVAEIKDTAPVPSPALRSDTDEAQV